MFKRTLISSLLLISPLTFYSENLSGLSPETKTPQIEKLEEKMKSHLDIIKNILDAGYAPMKWKENYFNFSLEEEIEKAKNKIDLHPSITVSDFQKIVRDFFMSLHDHHVSARFYSTEKATLPFLIKGARGKSSGRYFVTHVDYDLLSPSIYQMEVGDELVSFDGKSTHEVVLALQKEQMLTEDEGTDRALTELFLTQRIGALAHHVPKGSVTLGLRKSHSRKIHHYQLSWDYKNEFIKNYEDNDRSIQENALFKPLMVSAYDDFFKSLKITDKTCTEKEMGPNECSQKPGAKRSFIPTLGKKWWSAGSKNFFHAYLYENEAGNLIGYIRIPHYSASSKEVMQFREIIHFFEERSDALVIDQVNNPGGSLFFMCALASLLTEDPLEVPKHQIAINPQYVSEAIHAIPVFESISNDEESIALLGDDFHGYPVSYQMVKFFLSYFKFVVNEWNEGRVLTNPTHLYGFDQINRSPFGTYTKPILIVVNELSISCGDFFPAIFQDNQRATIMGAKTSGAGGFVLPVFFPNLFGLDYFRYTGSIAGRLNKDPIENLGVTPDKPYDISAFDLQHRYRHFVKAINETVLEILYRERS